MPSRAPQPAAILPDRIFDPEDPTRIVAPGVVLIDEVDAHQAQHDDLAQRPVACRLGVVEQRAPAAGEHGPQAAPQVLVGDQGGVGGEALEVDHVAVDARGTLSTPDANIRDALRLNVSVTIRTAALDPIERRELLWYRECLGEVARAVAPEGTTSGEITTAAQLRSAAF